MNVMAQAHKEAKSLIAARLNITYRMAFRLALIKCHKEYKAMKAEQAQQKQLAIAHFEGIIAKILVHFEKLGVNDYYIAIENNKQLHDYTILKHKDGDLNRLGWAGYGDAIVTHPKQADEYVKAFPQVVKLHAQTHLSNVLEGFRKMLADVQ